MEQLGLIFDGSDDSQHAVPAAIAINAKAVRTIQPRQRLRLSVAAVAGLGRLVENVADFGWIGGVADPPLLVKDAHLDHAGLVRHGLNRVVEPFAIVAQHVVRGAALDYIADPLGAGQRGRFQMLAVQSDIQISEQREDDDHHRQQRTNQLRTDAVTSAASIAESSRIDSISGMAQDRCGNLGLGFAWQSALHVHVLLRGK